MKVIKVSKVSKKIFSKIKEIPIRSYIALCIGLGSIYSAYAANDPFAKMNVSTDNLETHTGTNIGQALQYILILAGVLVSAFAAMSIYNAVNQDKQDPEHKQGSAAVKIIMIIVVVVFAYILIGIGWEGASAMANGT